MNRTTYLAISCLCLLAISGAIAQTPPASTLSPTVKTLDWDELLPPDQRDGFGAAPPAPMHDYLGERGARVEQSGSFDANLALNGARVKIPGFVVPLEIAGDGIVRTFFLVPYFGACMHVPPPPPNQIVYVKSVAGLKLETLYDPMWVTGRLRVESKSFRIGASAYTLESEAVEPYRYQ
jgi:uncharacterized protein